MFEGFYGILSNKQPNFQEFLGIINFHRKSYIYIKDLLDS